MSNDFEVKLNQLDELVAMYKVWLQESKLDIPFFPEEVIGVAAENVLIQPTIPTAIIIDVETLATTPDAVVFNLAALFFALDPDEQETVLAKDRHSNYLQFRFDIAEQVKLGRVIDEKTQRWWNDEVRQEAYSKIMELPCSPFKESILALHYWIKDKKEKWGCHVYYRGMDFDGPIIDSLYETAGIEKAWVRGDSCRDIRTFIDAKVNGNTGYMSGIPKSERDVSHTALGDCFNDARAMQLAYYLNKHRAR